jgi:hypothetical protein
MVCSYLSSVATSATRSAISPNGTRCWSPSTAPFIPPAGGPSITWTGLHFESHTRSCACHHTGCLLKSEASHTASTFELRICPFIRLRRKQAVRVTIQSKQERMKPMKLVSIANANQLKVESVVWWERGPSLPSPEIPATRRATDSAFKHLGRNKQATGCATMISPQ